MWREADSSWFLDFLFFLCVRWYILVTSCKQGLNEEYKPVKAELIICGFLVMEGCLVKWFSFMELLYFFLSYITLALQGKVLMAGSRHLCYYDETNIQRSLLFLHFLLSSNHLTSCTGITWWGSWSFQTPEQRDDEESEREGKGIHAPLREKTERRRPIRSAKWGLHQDIWAL